MSSSGSRSSGAGAEVSKGSSRRSPWTRERLVAGGILLLAFTLSVFISRRSGELATDGAEAAADE